MHLSFGNDQTSDMGNCCVLSPGEIEIRNMYICLQRTMNQTIRRLTSHHPERRGESQFLVGCLGMRNNKIRDCLRKTSTTNCSWYRYCLYRGCSSLFSKVDSLNFSQLIKPNRLVILPNDAIKHFLQKRTPNLFHVFPLQYFKVKSMVQSSFLVHSLPLCSQFCFEICRLLIILLAQFVNYFRHSAIPRLAYVCYVLDSY